MTASRQDIRGWLKEGIKQGATHVVVVCDTFDYEDYPVYVMSGEDVRKEAGKYTEKENMHRIMEIYDLSLDIEKQLNEDRAFNY